MTRTQEDASQLDSAIDSILEDVRGLMTPDDEGLVATARLLRRSLPRLHPPFGFEERLAARLATARRMELAPATAGAATPTPIRPDIELEPPEPTATDTQDEAQDRRRRHLVAGGAIASGVSLALPIAGAAIVAWRRTRSSGGVF